MRVGLAPVLVCLIFSFQDQRPQFRSGIDLVVVEVTVLDRTGAALPDLRPDEFVVKIEGKKRLVVSAQYSDSRSSTGSVSGLADSAAGATRETRSIAVVLDEESIRFGDAYHHVRNLADYLDGLPASDRISLTSLPSGSPQVPFSTDRVRLRSVLTSVYGTSNRWRDCDATFGEAAAASAGDSRGESSYSGRLRLLGCGGPSIGSAIEMYRRRALQLLQNLLRIAETLREEPGRRVMVLVSEGIFVDDDTRHEFARFSARLDAMKTVLYGIHLDFPFVDASTRTNQSVTRLVDDRYGFDGMAEAAYAAGGEVVRAISRVTPALKRIDRALDGRYLLAVERTPSDLVGKPLRLKVETTRRGAETRTRTHLLIESR